MLVTTAARNAAALSFPNTPEDHPQRRRMLAAAPHIGAGALPGARRGRSAAAGAFRPAVQCSSSGRRAMRRAAKPASKEGRSIDQFLATVLRDELKIEKERYRQSDELMEGPPEPWTVDDKPNTNMITLARTYNDEEIVVSAQAGRAGPAVAVVQCWRSRSLSMRTTRGQDAKRRHPPPPPQKSSCPRAVGARPGRAGDGRRRDG